MAGIMKNEGMIRPSRKKKYFCFICPEENTLFEEMHITLEGHRLRSVYFSIFFERNGNFVRCKTCEASVPLNQVIAHSYSHDMPWFRYKEEIRVLMRNLISYRIGRYYCFRCKVVLSDWSSMSNHIYTKNHRDGSEATCKYAIPEKLSLPILFCAIVHSIFVNQQYKWMCLLCNNKSGNGGLMNHLVDDMHIINEVDFEERGRIKNKKTPIHFRLEAIKTKIDNFMNNQSNGSALRVSFQGEHSNSSRSIVYENLYAASRSLIMRIMDESTNPSKDLYLKGNNDYVAPADVICSTFRNLEIGSNNDCRDSNIVNNVSTVLDRTHNNQISTVYEGACALPSTSSSTQISTWTGDEAQLLSINNYNEIHFTMCSVCDWMILKCPGNILRHSMSEGHVENISALQSTNNESSIDSSFTICETTEYFETGLILNSDVNMLLICQVSSTNGEIMKYYYWCNICEMKFDHALPEHYETLLHCQNIHTSSMENDLSKNISYGPAGRYIGDVTIGKYLPEGIVRLVENALFCTICTCKLPEIESIDEHIATYYHVTGTPAVIRCTETNDFECRVCDVIVSNANLIQHLLHISHVINKMLFIRNLKMTRPFKHTQESQYPSENFQRSSQSATGQMITPTLPLPSTSQLTANANNTMPITPDAHFPISLTQNVCLSCNLIIPGGDRELMAHTNSNGHKLNEAIKYSLTSMPKKEFAKIEDFAKNLVNCYKDSNNVEVINCKVCNIDIRPDGNVGVFPIYIQHLQTQEHISRLANFLNNMNNPSSSNREIVWTNPAVVTTQDFCAIEAFSTSTTYWCPICSEGKTTEKDFHTHLAVHIWPWFVVDPMIESSQNPQNKELTGRIEQRAIHLPSLPFEIFDHFQAIGNHELHQDDPQSLTWYEPAWDVDMEDDGDMYKMPDRKKYIIELGVVVTTTIDKNHFYCVICEERIKKETQPFYEHLCSIGHLDNIENIMKDHRIFRDYLGRLSILDAGYASMEEKDKATIKSHASVASLPHEVAKSVSKSIVSESQCHYYLINYYICLPCKVTYTTEAPFRKHFHQNTNHNQNIKRYTDIGVELIFDHCTICACLWFGSLKTFSHHIESRLHKDCIKETQFPINTVPLLAEGLLKSPDEIANRSLEENPNIHRDNRLKQDCVLQDLQKLCNLNHTNLSARPFGPRIWRSDDTDSSFDILLHYEMMPAPNTSVFQRIPTKEMRMNATYIENCLQRDYINWTIDKNTDLFSEQNAMIKVLHRPTNLQCKLVFCNILPLANSHLIRNYCQRSYICRKLLVVIESWMTNCGLMGNDGMNKYGIAWMVIFFLQYRAIIPPIAVFTAGDHKEKLIYD